MQPDDETDCEDDDTVEDTDAGPGVAAIHPYLEPVVGIKAALTKWSKEEPTYWAKNAFSCDKVDLRWRVKS